MNKQQMQVEVGSPKPLSPHSKALIAAGEEVMKSSISTTRDFCKSMIGISLSSIPVYIALLKIFTNSEETIPALYNSWWIAPIIFSLSATCAFTVGYLPNKKLISLDDIDELEAFLKKASNRRYYSGVFGFCLLMISILLAVLIFTQKA